MIIGNKDFDFENDVYIMGILNVTPDSFSDGGLFNQVENAVNHALQMEKDGAAIIDIGGESTRPGHKKISVEEETARVVPVIEELKNRLEIPISIDTSKAEVAEAALKAGASMINDVWGFKRDTSMAEVAVKYGVPCCLMHNKTNTIYSNLIKEIMESLTESINIALQKGVKREKIIIDPGIGFGKTLEQNLVVIKHLEKIKDLNYPLLLGVSRKSMIGGALDLPVDQRLEGTIAVNSLGVLKGTSIIRVHDVKENLRAVKMVKAILQGGVSYG